MFPTDLVDLPNPDPRAPTNSPVTPLAGGIANLNAVVEALQAKVGVDGSTVPTSLEKRLTTAAAVAAAAAADVIAAQETADAAVVDTSRGLPWGQRVDPITGYPLLPRAACDRSTSYFYAWPGSSSTARAGSHFLFVPVGTHGYYFGMELGVRNKSAYAVPFQCQFSLFKPGKHTKAASCTRVGTWNYISGITGALHGEYYSGASAAATISFACIGSIVAAQLYQASAGGFAVVSIDGSYSFSSPLPQFSATDLANGLCRAEDVGRYYVNCYNPSQWSTCEVLATGLSDAAHTVMLEVTGTKPAASSDFRVYVEALVGCTATDSVANALTHMVPVVVIHQVISPNGSGYGPVQAWAPVGSTNFDWLGTTHADNATTKEVSVDGPIVLVDNVDRSAATTGVYYGGVGISWYQESTASHEDNLATQVLNRRRMFTACAKRQHPITQDITHTYLVAGRVEKSYPISLQSGAYDYMRRAMSPLVADSVWLGNTRLLQAAYTANNDSTALYAAVQPIEKANTPRLVAVFDGKCLNWIDLLSAVPGLSGANSGDAEYVLSDRSDGVDKLYACDGYRILQPVRVNDTYRYISGFGALPQEDFPL